MFDEKQREHVCSMTVTAQIITAALAIGILVFAAVVLVLFQGSDQGDQENLPVVTYVALGFGVLALVASVLVPRLIDAGNRNGILSGTNQPSNSSQQTAEVGEVGLFMGMYLGRLIVGVAILEGAAFFNLAARIIEGQTISLIMAALLLVAILLKFPTRSSVENWIETERRTIEELRSLQS